ncbi:TPA: hypothetical protein MNM85_001882 [Citrobacter freundii]|nr:hypothetical protein [Citrobacter freundii]HBZ9021297.1 hypothetical protein [Citrobacter freundii]HCA0564279.1 hypothetical protein [Citrobacter freundii]HCA0662318.1 hypothetical protein [Citrobacter freundii]HCA0667475.1 hypothetical protein [Citrobacter freundii]
MRKLVLFSLLVTSIAVYADVVGETYILKCTPEKESTVSKPFFVQIEDTKNVDQTWSRAISWDNHFNIPLDMNGDTPNDAGEIENIYLFSKSVNGMLNSFGLVITNNHKQHSTRYGEVVNTAQDTRQGPHGYGICVQTDHQNKTN